MALHDASVGKSDEHYTPPHVFELLGETFDMDVSSPGAHITPWIPALEFITEGSLEREWRGFVWMNPPFGKRMGLVPWLEKFAAHGNGIALVPDRTSAPWWQWFARRVDLILFCAPRLKFIAPNGEPQTSPPDGTALCAIGERGCAALLRAQCLGFPARPAIAEVSP